MKITKNICSAFSTIKDKGADLSKINVAQLAGSFNNYFLKESTNYEMPLRTASGLLSYTGRFAKTVINIDKLDSSLRKTYFKKIKRAVLNSAFTPASCVDICESFINFPFEGDEEEVLNKMRDYATNNIPIFTLEQLDRFSQAHKYLMIEKRQGNVKFVNCELKGTVNEEARLGDKLKYLFRQHRISQYSLEGWKSKRQIRLQVRVGDQKRDITLKGVSLKAKDDEQEMVAGRLLQLANKEKNILIFSHHDLGAVSPKMMAEGLLIDKKTYCQIDKAPSSLSKSTISSIIKKIANNPALNCPDKVHITDMSPISYLNQILASNSETQLRQTYGYIKFNIFHLEYHCILQALNLKKVHLLKKELPQIDLKSHLEPQERKYFNFLFPEEAQAQCAVDFLREEGVKSLHLLVDQNSVFQCLGNLLSRCGEGKEARFNPKENRNSDILKSKLSLASVVYDLCIELPVISEPVSALRKGLFPLTHRYRQ